MDGEPLNETEARVWRSFVVVWRKGLAGLDATFQEHGMIHTEYGVMAVLSEQPRGTMCAGELADRGGLSSSRLSHRLTIMEERGDVTRCPSTDDARKVEVTITAQGRKCIAAVRSQHIADIRRLMFDPLDEEQTTALADALMTIASHLTDHPFLTRYLATGISSGNEGRRFEDRGS